jgi:hypothetical protein
MKKICIALLAVGLTGMIACKGKAEAEKKAEDTQKEAIGPTKVDDAPNPANATMTAEKEHACAADCKDGNHVYAHGEKNHTCGDACKKDGAMMHDHKCADQCKDGKHVYAHGEKDHACGEACSKKG